MPRFLVHALIFALVQLGVLAALWRSCPDDPDHYMAATVDKHARLRASAASPRLIFVGGSSVGFSIDSRAFADAPGLELEPVNMGLNDGLGLAFMLGEVQGQLRAGDVVVVAPETHLLWTGSQDDAVWAVLQRRPASVACLAAGGPRAVADVADQGLHFFARKVRCAAHQMTTDRALPTIYRRSGFDAYGDFAAHRELEAKPEAPLERRWPTPAQLERDPDFERNLDQLASFAARCEAAGARCFLAWCPTRAQGFADERAVYEHIEAQLRERVALPMLEQPSEVALPETDFFDRGPHLTGAAAATRSRRLAARLEAALGE